MTAPCIFCSIVLKFHSLFKVPFKKTFTFRVFFRWWCQSSTMHSICEWDFSLLNFSHSTNFGFIFEVFLKFCDINLAYLEQLVAIMISRKFGGVYQIRFISFYFIWKEFLEPWEFFENKLKLIQLGTTV